MTGKKKILWLVLGGIGAFLLFSFLKPKPPLLEIERVARGTLHDVVTSVASGSLEPKESRAVTSDTGGSVLEVTKRAGETVAKGDVVVKLDPGELAERVRIEKRRLDTARGALREATVRRDQTGNDYARAHDLYEQGVFSRKQAESAALAWRLSKSEVDAAQSTVEQLQSSVELLEKKRADAELKAPIAGVLQAVHVEAGQTLSPKQPAFEVMDASSLVVRAVVDEVDARRVAVGQEVRITADALQGQSFRGRVSWVAPVVSMSKRASRGVEVEIEIEEQRDTLRVGMSVDVEIVVGTSQDALSVSSTAVAEIDGTPSVFAFERRWRKYGRVHLRPIRAGIRTLSRVEVLEGLTEGELVVHTDVEKLRDGAQARAGEPVREAEE